MKTAAMTLLAQAFSIAAALGQAATPTPAPKPAAAPPPAPVAAQAGLYVGPASCGSSTCHGAVVAQKTTGVGQNEYFIWLKRDSHAHAYEVLFNDRSATIARNLHLANASEARICLDCHALSAAASRRQGRLELEDGISCEGCHGPASGWLEGHRSEGWTHGDSVSAGMTDLRRIEVRAGVCLACHQGAAGKTVDHDLIGAGHPVLGFELDNYTEGMPAHWLRWSEHRDRADRPDTHGTPAWAVGQAEALRAALVQLARWARASESAPGERWPAFSELACDGCHHSLATQRWKTERMGDRPGLPRWSSVHTILLRPLMTEVEPSGRDAILADLDRLGHQLARFDAPRAEVAELAEHLAGQLAAWAPALARTSWNATRARHLLLAISTDATAAGTDDQAARQLALAVQTLASQLLASDQRWFAAGLSRSAEAIAGAAQDRDHFDADRFASQVADLHRLLETAP
jgi:hypothetical protein